ncbi:type II toxin-antitoxin system RelE/ParE family toxin [Stenotrophomonas sp. ISL-67]|uniref:type II toxin-antitoxin system RelE/ParE family toxin n=1 Tax=Stenotrophomonas sp. ISL-67 TaxID=2819171 RepID=UPI001BEAEC03|nr:type II toxin-antitoxin system RelE/ParE family toxin [Stenotrophomonas sp. ISL-67]
MSVLWTPAALEDRQRLLDAALASALEKEDPAIYRASLKADADMEQEADALDGVATWRQGPLKGTRLYVCRRTRHLLIYTREGNDVRVIWVVPASSDWKHST